MPTATEFTALGAGNGLAKCPQKVDISSYDYWTTFSGVNKNNPTPTPELINESLIFAAKLFWNTHNLSCTAETVLNGSTTSVDEVTFEDADGNPVEPVDRSCNFLGFKSTVENPNRAQLSVNAILMFDGATDDASNFVGYGSGFVETRFTTSGSIVATSGGNSQLNAEVAIGGYGYTPDNTDNDVFESGYVTFEGAQWFAYVEAKDRPSVNASGSVTLNSLYANCVNSNFPGSATSQINSLDFYTY